VIINTLLPCFLIPLYVGSLKDFSKIREYLLNEFDLRLLGDVDRGAFEEILDEVVSTVMSVFQKSSSSGKVSIAMQPTPLDDNARDRYRTNRKRAAVLAQVGRFEFESDRFAVIKEKPIVYWWDGEFYGFYSDLPKLGEQSPGKEGLTTGDNPRFLRKPWEVFLLNLAIHVTNKYSISCTWVPYIKGASGKAWMEPLDDILSWSNSGLEVKSASGSTVRNETNYFIKGLAFTTTGSSFGGRLHRFRSVFDSTGRSVFPEDLIVSACSMNSKCSKYVMQSLNPTIHFSVGDVNRLPLFSIESANEIFAQLDRAFTDHEAARETSVEFKQPGASCWNYAQQWAQQAVDREPGTPLPDWNPVDDQPPAVNWVSYAIGVAIGRFPLTPQPPLPNGEGEPNPDSLVSLLPGEKKGLGDEGILPHGILYLSTYSGDRSDSRDSLNHAAAQPIKAAWDDYGSQIAKNKSLRDWLRLSFFKEVHVSMYEQRPIYFPLSSKNKNFVAYISIHRWADNSLQTLLADYLMPELRDLEGEQADLLDAQSKGDKKQQAQAEERRGKVQELYTELKAFVELVQQCAEQGTPAANPKDTRRQANAPFRLDLDDGVMVNSAALWCLLEPQWTKPKAWWSELCNAQGKKDYDWSHLAARYFGDRVDEKCQKDPSLAVAHGVFWQYHPTKAYEWELRLQDEIAPDFTIDEENSDAIRSQFEAESPRLVAELREKEEKRRERKRKNQDNGNLLGSLFEGYGD